MEKIAIIGSCGAGKSTLAIDLGNKLNLPVIHLDAYYWQPGWQAAERQQWLKIQQELVRGRRWIIDDNYGGTMNIRLATADTIIWLDFNRYLCLSRVLQRSIKYFGRTRSDMAKDCPERLNWEFWLYVWNFPRLQRPKIMAKIAAYRDSKRIIILQNPRQVLNLLQQDNLAA